MTRARSVLSALSTAAALLLLTAPASAKECEDVKLPDSVTVDGTKLVLNGMGVREATVLNVNVYVAGLYVEVKSSNAATLLAAEGPRQLVLRFVRDVDRDDVVEAYQESFNNSGQAAKFAPQIKKLLAMMVDAKDGVAWIYTYTPAKGLEVKIGAAAKGTIEGADFFEVFLGIWLGPKPPNKGLKTGLLGGECG